MAISRGGDAVSAAGPTELRRYLPISLIATAVVAGLPLWVAFGFGKRFGLLATVLSVLLSFGLAHLGALAWKRWPASRDVVFNDLMLWGFVRRFITQRRLIRRVERLGFSADSDPDQMTIEERTDLLKKLAEGLEIGDPYTHGHSQRVARHAYMVAKTMKLSRREAEKIRLAGVIHDVGKLRIPREIITKPGKLTDAEFDAIKRHTIDGAGMVEVLRDPEVTDMVRHHHERLDGSGYPDKLAGDQISIGARVLAVADTFDAASSLRPYRSAQKHKVALDILQEEARAGRLDADVVEAFVRYYSGRRALRWWAFLSSGPAYLYDLPAALVHRVGAAGLANAAVVGLTAVALAPGSPLHGRPVDDDPVRKKHAIVRHTDEGKGGRSATDRGSSAPAQSTLTGSSSEATRNVRSGGTTDKSRGKGTTDTKARGKPADAGSKARASERSKGQRPPANDGKASKENGKTAGEETVTAAAAVESATGALGGGVKDGSSDAEAGPTSDAAPSPATVPDQVGPAGTGEDKK